MGLLIDKLLDIGRGKRSRIRGRSSSVCVGFYLCWPVATPKIPVSHKHHLFSDMRSLLGVPNTLNVITNFYFPFLVVGVLGLVLSLQGCFFNISCGGEIWGWALFYRAMVSVAFGSTYYHLKPDDSRVMWDSLPVAT